MTYQMDIKDIFFNVFEFLNVNKLLDYKNFSDQNEELYRMVLEEAYKFSQKVLAPLQVSGDRAGCRWENGRVHSPVGFSAAFAALAENGYIGMTAHPNLGGQGLPQLLTAGAYEMLTGANIPLAMYGILTHGAAHLIESFAEDKWVQLFCEKMYRGIWAGTMCLTEASAGSAVGDLKTVAHPQEDGSYHVVGNKIFISGGEQDLTENIIHLVLARVPGDALGTKGISLFIVPKYWVGEDGKLGEENDVYCTGIEHKMGIKASATCSLSFGDKGKCRGILVGERSQGMKYMFQMMNEARLMCGLLGSAVASASYSYAKRYANERTQGGKTRIVDYPDVKRNLALSRAWAEGMRGLLYQTSLELDLSIHHPDEAVRKHMQNRVDLLTPICKAYCSDFGFRVTELCMQIYGGYGYISEYPIEQYMRDVKIASLYEGTNGIQAMDLLGRKLSMNQGLLFREYYEDMQIFLEQVPDTSKIYPSVQLCKKTLDKMAQALGHLAEHFFQGEKEYPIYSATPLLEVFGHVSISLILLRQAYLAEQRIKEGTKDVFYEQKILTASFFAAQMLPHARGLIETILSGDHSALQMNFSSTD